MVVHAFFALVGQLFGNIEVWVLGGFDQFGVYLEGKRSEIAVIDAPSCQKVLSYVLS